MPHLDLDPHTRLHYRVWGQGRPLLFLHGWALSADAWSGPMLHLSEQGFRCVGYDRRGHGRSGDPGWGYDFDTLADDLAALLDHLDLRETTLIAHSIGAGEAVRYLARHGSGRVARLALVAPMGPRLRQAPDFEAGLPPEDFQALRQRWREDFPGWLAENAGPFFGPEVPPATIQWGLQMAMQCSLKAALASNEALERADLRADFAAVPVPTLILHGDADQSLPLELAGREAARLLPRSRLEVYPGAPHGLMFSHLPQLNRDLLAFIREGGAA